MRKASTAILFLAVGLGACTRPSGPAAAASGLTPDEFVRVMVELKRTPVNQRDSVLKKHGTTDQELRRFVEMQARDPMLLSATFDSIQVQLTRKLRPGE